MLRVTRGAMRAMGMGSESHSRGSEIPPDSRGTGQAMTVKAGCIQGGSANGRSPNSLGTAHCAVLLASVYLSGCTPAVLDPLGPIGLAERTILIDSVAIMLAIVVPTIAATLGCAWWYRSSNARARHLPDWEYSGQL